MAFTKHKDDEKDDAPAMTVATEAPPEPTEEEKKGKLLYDLEYAATKGHSLYGDKILMGEIAGLVRKQWGFEGKDLLPNGKVAPKKKDEKEPVHV